MSHSMVSSQEDFTTRTEISLSRRSNLINFIEDDKIFQSVAYWNLTIHFSVNLPGRPELPTKVV